MTVSRRPAPDTPGPVGRAATADVPACALLVARAFAPLPQTVWLIDELADRVPVLAADFEILVEHALAHGRVDVIGAAGEPHAVAVWFHRDREMPEPADYDARVAAATGRYADRFRALDHAFESHHPAEPHHHLALLAVDPDRQGQGLGAALLAEHHARLDAAGVDAFLEASTVDSVRLYERHGYRALGEPYRLAADGPRMWPLWRTART
ncbi:GNAT family N-acetyltransferase [Actinokineospora enzanensis]|uniref:GNAT family N-acetyltransferase n=1 Tax=Actinokineospora enzanensis TaxID=155975 RepID=UPI00036BCB01|nr:GNAT family N-acetyltransferase [Actinokineospora enzanensis]